MELHKRYVHFPAIDLSILGLLDATYKNDPFSLSDHFVRHYNMQITTSSLDTKQLETFRMILCHEYQLRWNYKEKYTNLTAKDTCLGNIANSFLSNEQLGNVSESLALYDVILLQMVLYCNQECIQHHIIDFRENKESLFMSNKNARVFYMKILECFLDCLALRQYLYTHIRVTNLHVLCPLYLEDITQWLETEENKEWRLWSSIFPKLVNTFGPDKILPITWNFVLHKLEDTRDLFAALSIMMETCFPLNPQKITELHYTLCCTNDIWSLIVETLKSPAQQHRKQAIFILKGILDFISTMDVNNLKLPKASMVPFVCKGSIETSTPISTIKQNFFLVLESLEEKQYHLIAPALTHISSLIKGNQEHQLCNDCFNVMWIQLIFERMMQHENSTIVKQGILLTSKLDASAFNDTFLDLFVNVLNNTFLYEYENSENSEYEPKILKDIIDIFLHVEEKDINLTSRILKIMTTITWAPIPMYHMLNILQTVIRRASHFHSWQDKELVDIKIIVQKNLNMHSRALRLASQMECLGLIANSFKQINDFTLLANVLAEFPPGEALRRESHSWDYIAPRLEKRFKKPDVISFVNLTCKKYQIGELTNILGPKKFALIVSLFHKAKLILQDNMCPTQRSFNDWFSSLSQIHLRPYVDMTTYLNTFEFLSELRELIGFYNLSYVTGFILCYNDDILKFLLNSMKNIEKKVDYDNLNRYLKIIENFLRYSGPSYQQCTDYTLDFKAESIRILENTPENQGMQYMCALYVLHFCQKCCSGQPYSKVLFDVQNVRIFDDKNNDSIGSKGKLASDCYLVLSKLAHQYIRMATLPYDAPKLNWYQTIEHILEMGGKEVAPVIAETLWEIVDQDLIQKSDDRLNLESIFHLCWKNAFLDKRSKLFSPTIKELIGVIIHDNYLALSGSMAFISQFVEQLLEEGDTISKLKIFFLEELNQLDAIYLKHFQEALLSCLLHGFVLRRDEKIEIQTCSHIEQNFDRDLFELIFDDKIVFDHKNDAAVRSYSGIILYKYINEDSESSSRFLPLVLQRLEKYKNKRHFNNSYIHKIKHRIMQILLIIQPVLNETDTVTLLQVICDYMLVESNQHSVRLMQEWILIRIFEKREDLHCKLWEFFEQATKTRPGCTSSIASIVYHTSRLLKNDTLKNFIQNGIKHIARCSLGQQFNVRLYNQAIFVQLYKKSVDLKYHEITSTYKGLYDAAIESLQDGNFGKNLDKIKKDFYFSIFHPTEHYNIQTIYFELPRLTGMDSDELISPDLFEMLSFLEHDNHPLSMLNDSQNSLSPVKTSPYIRPTSSTNDAETLRDALEADLNGLSDIQKKIDPSIVNPLYGDIPSTSGTAVSRKKPVSGEEGLILVASLIDRTPNLGGLARTSEIFGVKELVIGNLGQVKERDFQSLSVSAEKWISITEVKPYELKGYLLNKKSEGWSLVGAEQTANSQNLLNMKFNKKTVLVLGNEKDGIPANLIPMLDTCVEIPQTGVIRSLNVHVTGALCIWQYAVQHILS